MLGVMVNYMTKILPESKIFKFFQNFTKINICTNNDEMNMFAEFQLNMTPGSTKMGTPILVKIPKNGGFTKMTNFSFSRIFSQGSVYLA